MSKTDPKGMSDFFEEDEEDLLLNSKKSADEPLALPEIPQMVIPSGIPKRNVGILSPSNFKKKESDESDELPELGLEITNEGLPSIADPGLEAHPGDITKTIDHDKEDLLEDEQTQVDELSLIVDEDSSFDKNADVDALLEAEFADFYESDPQEEGVQKSEKELYYEYFDSEEEEDLLAGFDLEEVVSDAIESGASDIHISSDRYVAFTILGEIVYRKKYGKPSGSVMLRLQQSIILQVLDSEFIRNLELDTSYIVKQGPHRGRRLRMSIGKTFGEIFIVMRVIADDVPTPTQLGIENTLLSWSMLPSGLVMVNGPTGTGKSTTIASMIRYIQKMRAQKIITIEKPIEFVYPEDGKAFITQREIGKDSRSFSSALDSAMRQAPDIIVVGEVRNQIEVNALLRAAETGHLAISTMHTVSPASTINRIMSLFEGDDQRRILSTLSDVTRGLANQVLVKTVDGNGRVAVREILPIDEEVKLLIEKGDVRGINDLQLREGRTMEQQLVEAVKKEICTREAARAQAVNPMLFDKLFDGKSA